MIQKLYRFFKLSAGVVLVHIAPSIHAAAITDGSVGEVQTLSGNFIIPQTLGTINGANLFHSFQNFSINTGETATFTTTSALQNVIARVTGGTASSINGVLRLDAGTGQPNFFFINPVGVTFGAGASVDVPAGFHVSTANYLKFADGNFYADLNRGSTLSAAAPEAFGFLGGGTTPAAVRFHNRDEQGVAANDLLRLATTNGSTFEVAAGAIDVRSAVLTAPAGTFKLAATGVDSAEISLASSSTAPLTGSIEITDAAIKTNGDGGGMIMVRGGGITLSNGGEISAQNTGAASPPQNPAITVQANGLIIDNSANSFYQSQIASSTLSSGNAGNLDIDVRDRITISNGGKIASRIFFSGEGNTGEISVRAGRMTIDSGSSTDATGIFSDTTGMYAWGMPFPAFGNAGNVSVQVQGQIDILNSGRISTASNLSFGNAGNINVTAGGLRIDSVATLDPGNADGNFMDGLAGIYTQAGTFPGVVQSELGKAGNISVSVPNGAISILGAGVISSSSITGNDAGNVDISAKHLTINSRSGAAFGGIRTSAFGGAGRAGSILIQSEGGIDLLNGGLITSRVAGSGDAGEITLQSRSLLVDGDAEHSYLGISGISSEVLGSGRGGNISIQVVDDASFLSGGQVLTRTLAQGSAGDINLSAKNILISGHPESPTGLFAEAREASTGKAGSIRITASDTLTIANHAQLSIGSYATTGDPASISPAAISIDAKSISLNHGKILAFSIGEFAASDIAINYTDRMVIEPGLITTSATDGNGGSISINGKGLLAIDHSNITTSVFGTTGNGNGGDINITAPVLALNTGFIQANTAAPAAHGGDVNINTDAVLSSANTLFVGGPPLSFDATRFGYNVIQAAAPDGVNGVIQIASPQVDLSGSLSGLSAQLMDFGSLAMDMCRIGTGSSLTPVGRGGLMPGSAGWIRP